jgi:hypothetical protein
MGLRVTIMVSVPSSAARYGATRRLARVAEIMATPTQACRL